jgi:sulfite exporter TauE/SafE
MTALDVTVPFALGLISSLHCTQMCGPIVLAYSLPFRARTRGAILAHLAYNAGRLTTYAFLGAIAGAAGSGMLSLGRMAGIERGAAIVAGATMILAGFFMTRTLPAQMLVRIGGGAPSWISSRASGLLKSGDPSSKLILGLLLGFLPCGLIYAALLKAVDTGSALGGAVSMLAFGAGTAGALLAIGLFSSAITARFGRYANTFATAGVMLLGAFLLARGLGWGGVMGHHEHHHAY